MTMYREQKKLSKGLLELKFMKRSKDKAERQEEDEERQDLYQDELAKLHEGADRVIMINSYYDCMNFLPCRLSFGGADTDIEKLNEDKLTGLYRVERKKKEASTGMEVDISAEEFRAGPEDSSSQKDRFLGDKTWTRDINRGGRGDHRGGGSRGRGGDRRGGGSRGRGGDRRGGGSRGRGGDRLGGGSRGRGGDRRGGGNRGRGGDDRGGSNRGRGGDDRGGGNRGRGGLQEFRGRGKAGTGPNRFDASKFGKSYQHTIMPVREKKAKPSGKTKSDEPECLGNPSGKRKSNETDRKSKYLRQSELSD